MATTTRNICGAVGLVLVLVLVTTPTFSYASCCSNLQCSNPVNMAKNTCRYYTVNCPNSNSISITGMELKQNDNNDNMRLIVSKTMTCGPTASLFNSDWTFDNGPNAGQFVSYPTTGSSVAVNPCL